jgi:hypothetical protein
MISSVLNFVQTKTKYITEKKLTEKFNCDDTIISAQDKKNSAPKNYLKWMPMAVSIISDVSRIFQNDKSLLTFNLLNFLNGLVQLPFWNCPLSFMGKSR